MKKIKLGIIGLGAIGGLVANAAVALGMKVVGCDPFMSVEAAWKLDQHVEKAATYDDIYACADYITLHVPATPTTKNMICADTIAQMKDGVHLLNFSRAELADFAEVGACGTAVVITPVKHIYYKDQVFTYGDEIGEVSSKLYYGLKAIQYGEAEDKHNWMFIVD